MKGGRKDHAECSSGDGIRGFKQVSPPEEGNSAFRELIAVTREAGAVCVESSTVLASLQIALAAKSCGASIKLPSALVSFEPALMDLWRGMAAGSEPSAGDSGPSPDLESPPAAGRTSVVVEVLDWNLASSWNERISTSGDIPILILIPQLAPDEEAKLGLLTGRVASALLEGRLKDPSDFSQWRASFTVEEQQSLAPLLTARGTDELASEALAAAISNPESLQSGPFCVNLNRVLIRPGFRGPTRTGTHRANQKISRGSPWVNQKSSGGRVLVRDHELQDDY